MEIAFLVIYTAILGLVAPYIGLKSEKYGSLVPAASALVTGAVLWTALTWINFSHTEAWIWIIVMLAMPAVMWIAPKRIEKARTK